MMAETQNPRTLVLFTANYPFACGGEDGFVSPEIGYLSAAFDRVIVVPGSKGNGSVDLSRYSNVSVNESLMAQPTSGSRVLSLRTIASGWFWRGIVSGDWKALGQGRSAILSYFRIVRNLIAFRGWFSSFVSRAEIDLDHTLFYTFWFTEMATTLGLMAAEDRRIKVVTRMHRFDIFEFAKYPLVLLRALRSSAMRGILRISPCSEDGSNYVRNLYPQFSNKIVTAYLGVRDPLRGNGLTRLNMSDSDNSNHSFRIVSISNVIALKRVDLIGKCLSALAYAFPRRRFVWTHIGNGKMLPSIKDSILSMVPNNLDVEFTGAMGNKDAHKFLSTGFDLGVHLSESEGLPFAIMEMLSYGIPVVACDAGGVRECVNDEDGILLPIETDPEAFVAAASPLLEDENLRTAKSDAAKKLIREKFSASQCRQIWVDDLCKVLS